MLNNKNKNHGVIYGALVVALLYSAPLSLSAQEVVIDSFPVGVGRSAHADLFEPHLAELRAIADTLAAFPNAKAIVMGSADGVRYKKNNDAKNAGLALGRAHALRNFLIERFSVDSTQILVQSTDVGLWSAGARYASVRIEWPKWDNKALSARIEALENRPPVERVEVQIKEKPVYAPENMGLRLGAGLSSSAFGAIPVVTGGVTWKRTIFVEALGGHTFWNRKFSLPNENLKTRRRMLGAQAVLYPFKRKTIGFVGGWVRVEQISQKFHQYVKLSEGPLVGLQVAPLEYVTITGAYNPSKERLVEQSDADSHYGRFMLYATANLTLGGGK